MCVCMCVCMCRIGVGDVSFLSIVSGITNACFLICHLSHCFAGPFSCICFSHISVGSCLFVYVCWVFRSGVLFHVLPCLFCSVCACAALQVVSVSACYWSNSKLVLVMQFVVPTLLCTHTLSFNLLHYRAFAAHWRCLLAFRLCRNIRPGQSSKASAVELAHCPWPTRTWWCGSRGSYCVWNVLGCV